MKRVLENNGKERAEKFKYLEQGLKLCELCALDKSVEVHLLQDVEAGELLAPLVFVQSCQHPESGFLMIIQNLVLLSMDRFFSELKCQDNPGQAFQAPASGLSRCSKYRANGSVLQGGQSLRVVDGSLVTQLIVP